MQRRVAKPAFAIALLAIAATGAGCAEGSYDQRPEYRASGNNYDSQYYSGYTYYADQCQREKHDRNVGGIAAGAIVGGLVGNAVTSGRNRTAGTIVGAAAGAAIGSNVARSSISCDNGRPYWTREQTAEYDTYRGYPGQRDDTWYRQHDCRWVTSERGEYVRVCRGRNDNYYPEY